MELNLWLRLCIHEIPLIQCRHAAFMQIWAGGPAPL
jgi:hypothetical protein